MDRARMKPESRLWRRVDRAGMITLGLLALAILILPLWPAPAIAHERLIITAFGMGMYLLTLSVSACLFARVGWRRAEESFGSPLKRAGGWIWRWHGMVAIALLVGACIGSFLYLIGGSLLGMEGSAVEFARRGAADGAFYFFIWCPGGALIVCFMQAFGPEKKGKTPETG